MLSEDLAAPVTLLKWPRLQYSPPDLQYSHLQQRCQARALQDMCTASARVSAACMLLRRPTLIYGLQRQVTAKEHLHKAVSNTLALSRSHQSTQRAARAFTDFVHILCTLKGANFDECQRCQLLCTLASRVSCPSAACSLAHTGVCSLGKWPYPCRCCLTPEGSQSS